MNIFLRFFAPLAFLCLSCTVAISAELVVIEQDGCPYCEKFNHEIAGIYDKTAEGELAPLRRVDLHQPWPADLAEVRVEQMTPTFILVNDGREVDRLVGYPGDEFFWFLLGEMLEKLTQR